MGDPITDDKPQVSNKLRQDWNNYTQWLAERGMKGHPSLDTNGTWKVWIDKYRKENPTTTVSVDTIPIIQSEFSKYRDWALGEIKAGRAAFAPQTNEKNFLTNLSQIDGIAGQRTTSFKFPESYLKTFNDGKLESIANKGFAVTNK